MDSKEMLPKPLARQISVIMKQTAKPVFKPNLLRWSLNCSVTAFILSVISIAIASYALSFNIFPVPVKYASFFASKPGKMTRLIRTPPAPNRTFSEKESQPSGRSVYDSSKVRAMQSSFLTKFFKKRMVTDDTVVIFQSIPLCGGDIFPGLAEKLLTANGKPRFAHIAELTEQYPSLPNNSIQTETEQLGDFIRAFIAESPKPLFIFIEKESAPFIEGDNIHHISLLCDPAYRLIEKYRVDHMSDDLQFALPPRMRMRTKPVPFEACFYRRLPECYGQNVQTYMLKHFCREWRKRYFANMNFPLESALDTAKLYTVIGHLEDFQLFLRLLEEKLPKYFSGVTEVFNQDSDFEGFRSKKGPLEGVNRPKVSPDTFKNLQGHIWPDYGFYWKTKKMFTLAEHK